MLRYESLFFIESENYMFRYNTNNDKLFIIKNKSLYKDYRLDKAEKTVIPMIYEREMIRIILEREYE